MSNKTLKITDKKGIWFRIKIITTWNFSLIRYTQEAKELLTRGGWFGGSVKGDWEALDESFIRQRSGNVRTRLSGNGDLTTCDLLILGKEGIKTYDSKDLFGMQLFDYEDILGVNSQGEGVIIQPWVMTLTPGRISWKVMS